MPTGHDATRTLRQLALAATAGGLIMGATIGYAMLFGDLSREGPRLLAMPWGVVSLVDIYLGLFLVALWVLWREQFSMAGYGWALMVLLLGNFVTCIYLIKACLDGNGSIIRLLTGRQFERHRP